MKKGKLSQASGNMMITAAKKIIQQLREDRDMKEKAGDGPYVQNKPVNKMVHRLYPNYPNPFTNSTVITLELAKMERVQLIVYDATGRRIAALLDKQLPAEPHRILWQPGNIVAGTYFLRITSGDFMQTQKMAVIK